MKNTEQEQKAHSQEKASVASRFKRKATQAPSPSSKKDVKTKDESQNQQSAALDTQVLRTQILSLQKERESLQDKLLRALAENKNILERMSRQKDEIYKFSLSDPLKDFSLVYEDILRAIDSLPKKAEENEVMAPLLTGLNLTKKNFSTTLGKYGVTRLYPIGKPFNHDYHQALSFQESQDQEDGTIIQVIQAGYLLHDRLLNPALVIIAKHPKKDG